MDKEKALERVPSEVTHCPHFHRHCEIVCLLSVSYIFLHCSASDRQTYKHFKSLLTTCFQVLLGLPLILVECFLHHKPITFIRVLSSKTDRPGCLQLLEILEISWNLKTLLEILEISWNLNGPPGNYCVMIENFCVMIDRIGIRS